MPSDGAAAPRALPAELARDPHRRHNPLLDEWVLVSAGRTLRPWLGAEDPPRHDLSLGRMPPPAVSRVIDVWAEQTIELGAIFGWVQVFENRGSAMGASNSHPHGQIWAGATLPVQGRREGASQLAHLASTGRNLLLDYAAQEAGGPRVVAESDDWLVVVPFRAGWPFETLVIPRRPVARLPDLGGSARDDLPHVLTEVLGRYDGLFARPFPYSMGWHQAPFGADNATAGWQAHAHFYPRSCTRTSASSWSDMSCSPRPSAT